MFVIVAECIAYISLVAARLIIIKTVWWQLAIQKEKHCPISFVVVVIVVAVIVVTLFEVSLRPNDRSLCTKSQLHREKG